MRHRHDGTTPCRTCGRPTANRGTQKCDVCLGVEANLVAYLGTPGGRARIDGLMRQAGYRVVPLADEAEERARTERLVADVVSA